MAQPEIPILLFKSVKALEAHMSSEGPTSNGLWLKLAKAGASARTISKDDAIAAALCCGWIDGQLRAADEHYYLVKLTPRRRGSRWSVKNRDAAERLAREGRVRPAGLLQIEEAKKDGRWQAAYQSQAKANPPSDFLLSLAEDPRASAFFESLDRANRYAIIYRINDAKQESTRSRRIAEFVKMLARGETLHPSTSAAKKARGARGGS